MMKPEEAIGIVRARIRIMEDVLERAERGELHVDCPECRRKDIEEDKGIAEAMEGLLCEVSRLSKLEGIHRSLVGDYAAENSRMSSVLTSLLVSDWEQTEYVIQQGKLKGSKALLLRFCIVGDENIRTVAEFLKGKEK